MKSILKESVLRNGPGGSEENGGGRQVKCIPYPVYHTSFFSCQYCLDNTPGHHMLWKTNVTFRCLRN